MNAKALWELLKNTFSDWNEDKAPRLAAALAYYTLFAIAPLLVIVIAIAGLFFGTAAARGQIVGQIQGVVGPQGGKAIQDMVANAAYRPGTGIVATIIGVVTLLFGAMGVFGQLQDALNTIWEVQPKPGRSWMQVVKDRLVPFTMVLGVAFLLLVSLVMSVALAGLGKFLGNVFPGLTIVGEIINFVVSFGVITLLFAMMYKLLPDAKIAWNDVWIGAAVTALLFTIGKFLLGLYLGRSSTASIYGAAGSLVIVLLWVYYSAQILFFGAEFTQVYAKAYGSRIEPTENAVAVTEERRAQQGIPRQEKVTAVAAGAPGQMSEGKDGGRPGNQERTPAPKRGVGALAGFIVGLLIGRRGRTPTVAHHRTQH